MGFLQTFHIDVELIAFIFSFEQVDLIGILIPDAEVLALFGTIGHGDPFIIGEQLHLGRLARADDGVVDGNGDITGRGSFCIAEIHVIEWPKQTHLPSFGLSGIDDVPHALHIQFVHL
jgi:hypothetical protein